MDEPVSHLHRSRTVDAKGGWRAQQQSQSPTDEVRLWLPRILSNGGAFARTAPSSDFASVLRRLRIMGPKRRQRSWSRSWRRNWSSIAKATAEHWALRAEAFARR